MEQRGRYFWIIAGMPHSGKTSLIAKLIKKYNQGNICVFKDEMNDEDEALSFLPVKTDRNWRQGLAPNAPAKFQMLGNEKTYKLFLKWILSDDSNRFRNGLLVIDDSGNFERNSLSDEIIKVLRNKKHRPLRLDVIMVYHGMTDIPIESFRFANKVIVFNTMDEPNYKKSKMPLDKLQNAIYQARNNYQTGIKTKNKSLQYKYEVVTFS